MLQGLENVDGLDRVRLLFEPENIVEKSWSSWFRREYQQEQRVFTCERWICFVWSVPCLIFAITSTWSLHLKSSERPSCLMPPYCLSQKLGMFATQSPLVMWCYVCVRFLTLMTVPLNWACGHTLHTIPASWMGSLHIHNQNIEEYFH